MDDLRNIDGDFTSLRDENLTKILLYGYQIHDDSQRFDEPLFNST